MGQYKSQYTGPQIDAGVDAALNPDVTVTQDSDALVTSGAVADALDNIDPTITGNTDTTLNGILVGNGSKVGTKSLDTSSLTNDGDHVPVSSVVKSALDVRVMKCSTAFAIPAVNSPVTKSMAGLTAEHELVRWNFADSGTPVAENAPPVDLTWTTAAGQFTITNTGGTTTYTIQPVFALPSAIAIT